MGAQACAFDRDAMLAGFVNAPVICFQGNTSWHSLLPSDLDSDLPLPPARRTISCSSTPVRSACSSSARTSRRQ